MLKKQINQFISALLEEQPLLNVVLYKEEKEYVEKHNIVKENITIVEKEYGSRFQNAYIERCDKETENMIAEEKSVFLAQPIHYFKKHKNEFIYIESNWFDIIGIDALSFEIDDVFGTYEVMLGLKLQKKFEANIKEFLTNHLKGEDVKYNLMFSHEDGLWNLNFALNDVSGFNEEMSIDEALHVIYSFIFQLAEEVEESM